MGADPFILGKVMALRWRYVEDGACGWQDVNGGSFGFVICRPCCEGVEGVLRLSKELVWMECRVSFPFVGVTTVSTVLTVHI